MACELVEELVDVLSVDVSQLSLRERAEHMGRLEQARTRFEARMYEELGAFDRSAAWQLDAAANPSSWLAAQTGTARAVAGSRMRLAGQLREMTHTAEAMREGSITEAHARVLARCVANPRVREAFLDQEVSFVSFAMDETADELARRVDEWIELMDQEGAEPRAPEHDVVHANQVGDRVKIDADLGLETGLPLLAALRERTDQLFRRDQAVADANPNDGLAMRTAGNRRAEALVELVMAGSGAESNPARREPLFMVHVDEETFLSGKRHPDTLLELTDGTIVPTDIFRRWREGSRYQTIVLDAAREVLYLGREKRYANREQRRALAARDRGCAVPGCDRPPEQCDAHHVLFWDDLGETNIDLLVLACRHHHRMIHAGKLTAMMIDGVPVFLDEFEEQIVAGRRRRPPDVTAA